MYASIRVNTVEASVPRGAMSTIVRSEPIYCSRPTHIDCVYYVCVCVCVNDKKILGQ